MTERWRLILHPPHDGATNMAIDEAILCAVGSADVLPTLRLYAWSPACLSLGCAQHAADVDVDRLREQGWDAVRRMTGGRAILHGDELTYSVALPKTHALAAGGIVDSYRRLSAALLDALNAIGLAANTYKGGDSVTRSPSAVCFEQPSDYEITADGKKLIGSAQARKHNSQHGVILQHGSLPLSGDLSRICDALSFCDAAEREAAKARVLARAITLETAIGRVVSWQTAAEALSAAFAARFDIHFVGSTLSAAERVHAEALRESRYAADTWTFRR